MEHKFIVNSDRTITPPDTLLINKNSFTPYMLGNANEKNPSYITFIVPTWFDDINMFDYPDSLFEIMLSDGTVEQKEVSLMIQNEDPKNMLIRLQLESRFLRVAGECKIQLTFTFPNRIIKTVLLESVCIGESIDQSE